ncbi:MULTISPECIES: 1-acyl-sn-glycerol-3-phosphate acyltransferase [unclassified Gemella]|uniref:lysophospholipid acyltransferase family protein n=1 Tax=unclassified Gemella TaxID=2624949 RepID=UPI0010741CA6|nr:1-acyl-sn-glycerol-3-phosphate acyltransferase [Gemella sp. GL1.1]MBF0747115.1 1-acyl-sn-glycerol-3-phosphate acyltransferase [Gemella sp. 19428wG2_WT2a]NYS27141.1 1-acyl-sn-glycerol-3-phosphate acyltransferase [Gemella sp. GL1]TFU58358.1 1-acyl-sn-glycerol-3-phosphate acyltransferase [Gemella sp. WT2a]
MYRIIKKLIRTYYKIFYKISIVNKEKLENASGVVLSGNHTSNHDPVLIYTLFDKATRFIAKEELFKIPILKNLLEKLEVIPVKRGSFDRACIAAAVNGLKSGQNIGIFPEGTRSKSKDLKLGEGHSGVSLISSRAGANVLTFAIIPKKHFRLFSEIKIVIGDEINVTSLREEGYKHDQITSEIMKSIENIIKKEI